MVDRHANIGIGRRGYIKEYFESNTARRGKI
jgi:hypothetical protein